ncbi:protein ROLLING AND ERECT LEAF 2-like [Zingiber officinale]|uniref:protein ROLLING AND ERECT LEAF 2-like n=1 Tax=Zingiber officinale TaxID=94328 RepID=UPI001C4DD3BB|nr:protein ROLLING AND ERECT LEAF 2-like [Zingiber officinale]XP_042446090.1 protein ROLLING AND ERECT LEAF 2-like [Zingiber officinale]XP_042446091.1 protein ROLLING AND ERECT LEAF 2-like [Zingiber officinale]
MGCGGSKPQEEAAVALCRQRFQLLAEAIRCRYALADAHAAYARSLQSVGVALHEFVYGARPPPPASPVLPLPAQRKGDPVPLPAAAAAAAVSVPSAAVRGHSRSQSGSHIHFHPSDSDTDDISPFHSDGGSPLHHLREDDSPAAGQTYVHLNYAKKGPAQSSITYEQQPPSSESVRFGSVDEPAPVAYPYYGYPYPPQDSNFYPSYPSYPSYMNYGDGMSGGFFGSSSPPSNISPPTMAAGGVTPAPREPPPPPSPKASTWDFLNPFESFDNYYAPYTPSRSSRELREEEGIPDLEDEDQEVVKEAYGDPKYKTSTSSAAKGEYSGKAVMRSKEVEIGNAGDDSQRKSKSMEAGSSLEHEDHVVEKSVVAESAEWRTAGFTILRNYQNDPKIVQEIKAQFDRVSESVEQSSKMLEVGKALYQKKDSLYKVSARLICGLLLFPNSMNADLSFEEDDNLSSTLQKLYSWEQKLLAEVMVEEGMRVHYERKHEHLRYLSERGAEAEKLEAVETSIRKLSTKIRISIQVASTISNKINQLRDGELWLRVCEIIRGFEEMWRVMSECHHIQYQAISQAKNLDSVVSGGKFSDADAIKRIELVMAEWITNFSIWVTAQKMYVNALNGWLMKGIAYEPEVTDDGEVPFSPGRLGAPPVFVICNYWSSSINMVSERDVVKAALSFIESVINIWKEHKAVQQQRQLTNRDMDSKLQSIEKEEQEMLKQRQRLLVISSENGMPTTGDQGSTVISFQSSLSHIFQAVENFSANTVKLYEVLNKQTEEEKQKLTGASAKVQ